jgi:hypothetical protein
LKYQTITSWQCPWGPVCYIVGQMATALALSSATNHTTIHLVYNISWTWYVIPLHPLPTWSAVPSSGDTWNSPEFWVLAVTEYWNLPGMTELGILHMRHVTWQGGLHVIFTSFDPGAKIDCQEGSQKAPRGKMGNRPPTARQWPNSFALCTRVQNLGQAQWDETIAHQNKKARNLKESPVTNVDFPPEQDDDNLGTMTNCQDRPIKVPGYQDFGHNMGKASDQPPAQNRDRKYLTLQNI